MNSQTKSLPAALTSYDLLKTFAVLTMIIDHIGFHFYPEAMWWRAVGRLSAPVWLFLVGYALSRDFSARLWIGAAVLIVASGLLGPAVLPVNILVTILCVRLVLDHVADRVLTSLSDFARISALIVLLTIPTIFIFDYGAVALSIALYGAAMRRSHEGAPLFSYAPLITGLTAFAFYITAMLILYKFSIQQDLFFLIGSCLVFGMLSYFQPLQYPVFTQKTPKIVTGFLQFCGRRTLEIYVVHLLLFKMVAVYLGTPGFTILGL